MCVPVSTGFSKMALVPARIEYSAWQMCVCERNTQRQIVVSLLPEPGFLAKNQLPTQVPEWITVPGISHLNPTEPEWMLCPVRQLKLYIQDSERPITRRWSRASSPTSIACMRSVCSHCYAVLNEEYLIISWYLHVRNGVAVARNPPTCPAEKRSLGENLVNDGRMWCSAQVWLRIDIWGDSISLCEISPGISWWADYMQPLLLPSVHEHYQGSLLRPWPQKMAVFRGQGWNLDPPIHLG